MLPIEALADAIMTFEGWHYGTRSWRNRNPGNLRPTTSDQPNDGNPTDSNYDWRKTYRTFMSLSDGWSALIDDLFVKLSGMSSHKLTDSSTLQDLLNVYAPAGDANNPNEYCKFVASWVSNILQMPITPRTTLGTFKLMQNTSG